MQTITALLAALLSLIPVNSPAHRRISAAQEHIIEQAVDASQAYDVPPEILLAVAFKETWIGTHPNEGGNWGAPRPGGPRNIAGTPRDAARVLARGHDVCTNGWFGAVARFRSGDCSGNPVGDAYARSAMDLARRMTERAAEIAASR